MEDREMPQMLKYGERKRLKLCWQLYVTWLPVRDLENFRLMDFCSIECTSYYRAEVIECYPFFVVVIYYGVLLVFLFLICQFFSEIIYGMYGISIILCYGKYCFPFFFFGFFCDGECYRPIYIVSECCNFVLLWMFRGKLDCCISTCSFP